MNAAEFRALGLKKGDRVRVTFETDIDEDGDVVIEDDGKWLYDSDVERLDATVEKVEPPFKPGDVIRSKALGYLYLIGEGAYLDLRSGDRNEILTSIETLFRRDRYERVTV